MFTDEGVRMVMELLRRERFTMGLWGGNHYEVRGINYERRPVVGWSEPVLLDDAWRITAEEVAFLSVGIGGWGRVDGFLLARGSTVLFHAAFEPMATGQGDLIRVVPYIALKAL